MASQLLETPGSLGQGGKQGQHNKKGGIGWRALPFLALAQFMVVLDGTIVNLALPRLQMEMASATRPGHGWSPPTHWSSELSCCSGGAHRGLLGGAEADFHHSLGSFAIASLIGGLAQQPWELIGARALQGIFAALLAPAALALLTVAFPGGKDRGTAFAIFGSISGVGAAAGVLLGGFLTEFVSWRWCFFVNVPIAVIASSAFGLW